MTVAEVWLSEQALHDRRRLDATQDRKLRALARRLADEVTLGDQVPKERIPRKLKRDCEANNLWRLELPGAWRVLYTIMTRPNEVVTVSILRILTHKEYDKLLGYSTS